MIPRIQQERPNVIKRYYCSTCGTKLQHSKDGNYDVFPLFTLVSAQTGHEE